jgi:RNA polymerase sigma-B factor
MPSSCRTRGAGQRARSGRDLRVLFERCAEGDGSAREAIIVEHLPYARWLARRYMGHGERVEDLYQVATVGLIKAVDRYEPDRCERFIAFAKPTILGEIRRHFRDALRPVHVPRAVQDCLRQVVQAEQELRADCGSHPSTQMIAEHLDLKLGAVVEAQRARAAAQVVSLDAVYAAQDGQALALNETIGELDPQYQRIETCASCALAIQRLPLRKREVLLLRFGAELSQGEIASRIGVSQMQVSRILHATLAALAAAPELQEIVTYEGRAADNTARPGAG